MRRSGYAPSPDAMVAVMDVLVRPVIPFTDMKRDATLINIEELRKIQEGRSS